MIRNVSDNTKTQLIKYSLNRNTVCVIPFFRWTKVNTEAVLNTSTITFNCFLINKTMSESEIISEEEIVERTTCITRPSLGQVKAMIEFMQKNPRLSHRKHHLGSSKLWIELTNLANSRKGAKKSVNGWIKFWYNKLRSIDQKQTLINEGKLQKKLTLLEQKILDLYPDSKLLPYKKKNSIKEEPSNEDTSQSIENIVILKPGLELQVDVSETEDGYMEVMDKMIGVMKQQAVAMSQLAETSLTNSKAMERIAEAHHNQAIAVDKAASTFEKIHSSIYDVRNAIVSIDYTLKRYYSATSMQNRQNLNIFN